MKRWVSILTTCAAGSVQKGKDIGNYMFTYRNVNIMVEINFLNIAEKKFSFNFDSFFAFTF